MFRAMLLASAIGLGQAALAQPQQPRERTGPEAQPPEIPDFAEPVEQPPAVTPPSVQAPVPVPAAPGIGPIREVRVIADGDGSLAVPPAEWTPPADPVSGLSLGHSPGQPLDPDWVRSQFAANLPSGGGPVSTAVALMQLVNRAFLTAGFVNSGLVVGERDALQSGILDLRLIYGGISASDGVDPVVVLWGEDRNEGLSADYVRHRFPSAYGRPLSAVSLERDFRLMTEDPAIRTVSVDLRPSERAGEATLHVTVYPEERFDLYFGAANDRSPSVGGERIFAGGSARNLILSGDILTAEGGLTEGIEDVQAGYAFPVATRTMMSFRGALNKAAVIDVPLLPLDIEAEDRSFQAGINHVFVRDPLTPRSDGGWDPSRTLSGGLILFYRHQKSFLLGQPFSFAPGSVDGVAEYGALRLTGDYLLRNVDQVLAISATATIGLGGTQSDVPSIPNPSDHFKALLVQVNYARRLDESGLELRARLAGQIADGVLYSGERFSIGGYGSVRGYRENLFLVDNALTGSLEFAYPFSLSGRSASGGFDWGAFTASVFADAAAFENVDSQDPGEDFVASVGVGLAWTPSDAIQASITYGLDLVDVPLPGGGMGPGPGPGPGPGGGSLRDIQDDGIQFRIVIHPLRLFRR